MDGKLCSHEFCAEVTRLTQSEDYLEIDTPENVVFGYEVAGIGSRFLAALVDTVLIIILQAIVYITLLLIVRGFLEGLEGLTGWVTAALGLIAFALLWGYYIFFELLWNGQSPGKRLFKLRVIRADGTPITLTESLIRNLVRLLDLLPFFYGIGIVTMFADRQSRRLGDLAAGTLVVFEQADVTLDSLEDGSIVLHDMGVARVSDKSEGTHVDLPVERLTDQDILMVKEYLRRRSTLANPMPMAGRVARAIHARMGLPYFPMEYREAVHWLAQVIDAYHNQER
jgi:uncharacterized RDD family membrane protein YckC